MYEKFKKVVGPAIVCTMICSIITLAKPCMEDPPSLGSNQPVKLVCEDPPFLVDSTKLLCEDPPFLVDSAKLLCEDPPFLVDSAKLLCEDPPFLVDSISSKANL